jgi:hypothetical protein
MLEPIVIKQLQEKFNSIHPLIFHRSVEKAKTNGDLFDILSTIPEKYPIIWNDEERRWNSTTDMYQNGNFFVELAKYENI